MSRTRTLAVVDVENLVGSADMTHQDVLDVKEALHAQELLSMGDHVIVGSSHHALEVAGFAWKGPRHVVRSGQDGADLVLLEVLETEHVAERFTHVVIASGDGIFTDVAAWLGGRGVHVTVLARPESLSKRLRMAAAETRFFDVQTDVFTRYAFPQKDIA